MDFSQLYFIFGLGFVIVIVHTLLNYPISSYKDRNLFILVRNIGVLVISGFAILFFLNSQLADSDEKIILPSLSIQSIIFMQVTIGLFFIVFMLYITKKADIFKLNSYKEINHFSLFFLITITVPQIARFLIESKIIQASSTIDSINTFFSIVNSFSLIACALCIKGSYKVFELTTIREFLQRSKVTTSQKYYSKSLFLMNSTFTFIILLISAIYTACKASFITSKSGPTIIVPQPDIIAHSVNISNNNLLQNIDMLISCGALFFFGIIVILKLFSKNIIGSYWKLSLLSFSLVCILFISIELDGLFHIYDNGQLFKKTMSILVEFGFYSFLIIAPFLVQKVNKSTELDKV